MSSLTEFLASQHADQDAIQQALRYFLADRLPDVTPHMMRTEMSSKTEPTAVAAALAQLEGDPQIIDAAALFVLSAGWDEAGDARDSFAMPSVRRKARCH